MLICGVDEAGRGALVGSVFAAAVILPKLFVANGLKDSKKITSKKRDYFYDLIIEKAVAWSIASANAQEIDEINILQASLLAMQRAVFGLGVSPDLVRVDGNCVIDVSSDCEAVIGGDDLFLEISAASVLAKVARDREMVKLAKQIPGYGIEKHKGYATKQHIEALFSLGVTKHHRRSFKPVSELVLR